MLLFPLSFCTHQFFAFTTHSSPPHTILGKSFLSFHGFTFIQCERILNMRSIAIIKTFRLSLFYDTYNSIAHQQPSMTSVATNNKYQISISSQIGTSISKEEFCFILPIFLERSYSIYTALLLFISIKSRKLLCLL